MTSSPATIVRQLLLDLSLGTTSATDWPVFVSFLPEQPDEALCVYDTSGKLDGRLMADGWQIEHPGVQVRVRGREYPVVWAKAQAIALAVDALAKREVELSATETYKILNASRRGAIMPLGVEMEGSRRRYDFTVNMELTIEQKDD